MKHSYTHFTTDQQANQPYSLASRTYFTVEEIRQGLVPEGKVLLKVGPNEEKEIQRLLVKA